jgi:hypothetical protein
MGAYPAGEAPRNPPNAMSNRQQLDTLLSVTISEALWAEDYAGALDGAGQGLQLLDLDPDLDPTGGGIQDGLLELQGLLRAAVDCNAGAWAHEIDALRVLSEQLLQNAADDLQEG